MTEISNSTQRSRVLSGMRPTGRLHLGNYMGALYNWVKLQNEYDCYFFIADWHALTTDYADPSKVHQNTMEVALDFLSAGLDPEKCTIFVQSHVPQHAELQLLFSMFTPLSWLERIPTYKDQIEQLKAKDLNTYGFLGYPLLQSADILLYRPQFVPVGQDQVSHVEITREIARRFNHLYGRESFNTPVALNAPPKTVLLPEPDVLLTPTPKLPGTDGRKMSKSYNNFISLTDDPPIVMQKLLTMTNGGQRPRRDDPGNPDICPVGDLHRIFSRPEIDTQIREGCRTARIACENCKEIAAMELVSLHLNPIQQRRSHFERNPELVIEALERGSEKARQVADETLKLVRSSMNLSRNLRDVSVNRLDLLGHKKNAANVRYEFDAAWLAAEPTVFTRNIIALWLSNAVPSEVQLKEDAPRVLVTRKGKRVGVGVAKEDNAIWSFEFPPKSFEVLALLCVTESALVRTFIVPQSVFVAPWSATKRIDKKQPIAVKLRHDANRFVMQVGHSEEVDISEYLNVYDNLV